MKRFFEKRQNYLRMSDLSLIAAALAVSAVSCIMLYSIASNDLISRCDMGTVRTQIIASALGFVVVIVLSVLDYNRFARLWVLYVPVALLLVLLTFTATSVRAPMTARGLRSAHSTSSPQSF